MLYSDVFGKTIKLDPKDEVSKNAILLIKAGFIDKLFSGKQVLHNLQEQPDMDLDLIKICLNHMLLN